MRTKRVRKAVISASGFGTRMLPITKALPKQMLPLVDKPIIQHVVEELVASGIEEIILVTRELHSSIDNHFRRSKKLETYLKECGKLRELGEMRELSRLAKFRFLLQTNGMGNAVPIINSRRLIKNEPFVSVWADDFILASPSWIRQLIGAYEETGGAVLSCLRSDEVIPGTRQAFAVGHEQDRGRLKIERIVEAPPSGKLSFEILNGAVYNPDMIEALVEARKRKTDSSAKAELTYVDGVNILLERARDCYALEIRNARYYDCGNKFEYLKTIVELGLRHPELKDRFKDFLKSLKLS